MHKILFPLSIILSGCSFGGYDTIIPTPINHVKCPEIRLDHSEKEFEIEHEDDDFYITSELNIKDAECIANGDHISVTASVQVTSECDSDIQKGDVIAFPFSYDMAIFEKETNKLLKRKLFFRSHDFTAQKSEHDFIENHKIKIIKSNLLKDDVFVTIGFHESNI